MTLLRSTAFNVFFFASTFVLALWGVVLRWSARARIPGLVRDWARLELDAARAICGIRFAVTGREHIPAGAALVASQHQSTFDTLVWFHLLPGCCCVAKRELTRIPLFGALIRPGGLIVVDRSGGAAALRALVRDARRVLSECRPIVIFPEGRRAEPGRPPSDPARHRRIGRVDRGAGRAGIDQLGGVLGTPRIPQAGRRDPDCDTARAIS